MKRIPKIPQGEISSIKNILYPDLKPKDKKWELKNIHNIKIIEEKNKKLKEEKQNIGSNELYKIDKFKNIPSKLKTDVLINEQKPVFTPKTPFNKDNQRRNTQKKPSTSNQKKKPYELPAINKEEENIYNLLNNKKESMFDNYYSKRLRAKTPSLINHINNNIDFNNNIINNNNNINTITPYNLNENENKNINNIYNDNNNNIYLNSNELNNQNNNSSGINNSSASYDKLNILEEPKIKDSSEIERLILEYKLKYGSDEALENIIKDYSKNKQNVNDLNSIPEVEEKLESTMKRKTNIILPKIQKNYIRENRKLITENKIVNKHKIIEQNNNPKHKNYGKIPAYIKKYEMEREIKNEEIKRQKEAEKIPKGTKLLTEEERVNTLNALINSKKELINKLEKMPITTRTMAIQNQKNELTKRLEEVEKGIEMFSKKQVFIQV